MTTRLAAQAGCHAGVGAAGEVGLLRLPDRFVLGIGLGHEQWAGRIDGGFASTDRVVLCFGSVQHA
ncbi:hypothetical protein [Roseicitreum antarcticum]|nr:hypothetical protein [Roseicitreum antarcticum]